MSIYKLTPEQALREAIEAELLVPWKPTRRGFGSIRILAVERSVHGEILKPWGGDDSHEERLRQKVVTTFDNFVGDKFALRLVFKQTSKAFGTAAMRILSPNPGMRVMGGFLSETVFVGTSVWDRSNLPYRFRPEQTEQAKITHRELNEQTRNFLKNLLGRVCLYRPPSLRR
jgi:hypothetical protein